mmetsp:Transcript_10888/g.17831  ORF Transcript_10888/g.17831 Transcript_10888/m.17831 type:complete len:455 (-) Transcript_10888:1047-2411(-)|eukprot:CAMPEP_0203759932 /NCGR_PEP_ID=MMETSP0098-20131031/13258_1 /ASSEMBLY_ACC=CAM_ASM_000208 /TAXON_ID=96639 /ORGANISM=" , Strain NY0313808BC1" /LENGTH=454 /DNA_ID=CAMNT_0050653257 /DNA_START=97 /DNA_END=1461 /DNA_ORIENTATION=+
MRRRACDSFDEQDGVPALDEEAEQERRAIIAAASRAARWKRKQDKQKKLGVEAVCGIKQEVGNESGAFDEKERRAIVAAASRATRQKRKRERETLEARNKYLETSRDRYLEEIAQLQTELQMVNDTGSASLAEENEILQHEVKKLKTFVQSLVHTAGKAPETKTEEHYRILKNIVNSSMSQVAGFYFRSRVDPSWEYCGFNLEAMFLPMRVQRLPLGAPPHQIKRVNVLIEMPDRKENLFELKEKLWGIWTSPATCAALVTNMPSDKKVSINVSELPINFKGVAPQPQRDDLRVMLVEENSSDPDYVPNNCVCTASWRYSKVVAESNARNETEGQFGVYGMETISFGDKALSPNDPNSAIIMTWDSTTEKELVPSELNTKNICVPAFEGHILRPSPDGVGTKWTVQYSVPLSIEIPGLNISDESMRTNNVLGPGGIQLLSHYCSLLDESVVAST